jgi:hypothetical protein
VKFTNALDEMEHWLQLLTLEMLRGAERRYLVAIGRLCEVFADKVSRDKRAPSSDLERRMKLSVRWLSVKRQLEASVPGATKGSPIARRVGGLRVIDGGRARR